MSSVCVCMRVCVRACTQSLRCVRLSGTLWKLSTGSSVHGIFQARILELVAISYSRMITINLCIILVKIFVSIILSFIIFSVNVSHSFWLHYYSNARTTWRLHRKTKSPSDIHHEHIWNKQKTQANQILPYVKIIIHQKQVESSLDSSLDNKACFQAMWLTTLSVFSCYHDKWKPTNSGTENSTNLWSWDCR